MKRPLVALTICLAFAIAVMLPTARPVHAGSSRPSAGAELSKADLGKAEKYCVRQGGEVDVRAPYFNTNDDEQNWFRLSGERQFCKFTSAKDGSRISR